MKTALFDFSLPPELIAQTPAPERSRSRLLDYSRENGTITHRSFQEILGLIPAGDLLVLNASKVLPARIFTSEPSGRNPSELLFIRKLDEQLFEAMVRPGRRFKVGSCHSLPGQLQVRVEQILEGGTRVFSLLNGKDCLAPFRAHGEMPLPPYITSREASPDRYQTVYAREEGSIAAPTAGLHFDEALLGQLRQKGVLIEELILHVGLATFKPMETEDLEAHQMHFETFCVSDQLARTFAGVRERGNKVWACGTTSIRSLESAVQADGSLKTGWQKTNLFIQPGFRFQAVDRFVTNFHLPRSTLLVLVAAICGLEKTLSLYAEAIARRYRFFSFGDAMVIR